MEYSEKSQKVEVSNSFSDSSERPPTKAEVKKQIIYTNILIFKLII